MTSIKYVEPPPLAKDEPRPVLPWLIVVGVGGRAGARQLAAFVAALPADLPAALLVSLHGQRPDHPDLAQALRRVANLAVVTAFEGEALHAGVCYVADARHHLCVAGVTAHLVCDPAPRGRTIDLLFQAAAATNGMRVAGVLLPGLTRDGAEGLASISQAGGAAFALRAGGRAWGPGAPALHPAIRTLDTPSALALAVEAAVRGG